MADESASQAAPQTALPLAYESPQPRASNAAIWGTVLVALLVCGTSIAIFALEEDGRRRTDASDTWPAAVAVLALALMGISIGFFLNRRR